MWLCFATLTTALSHAGDASTSPQAPAYGPADGGNPQLQMGAWSETVPLELPPGPGGLVPGIALTADFHVPDGPLGPGWRLDGLSRIDRIGQFGGVAALDGTDAYTIDGVRLYPDMSGTLRAEKDDGRLFTNTPALNQWKVQKDGWTWTYGELGLGSAAACAVEWRSETLTDCEDFPGAGVMYAAETTAWLLSRVQDPHGNPSTTARGTI